MCLDKSTFNFIRSTCTTIRRPWGSNRYDSRYTVITVKHPDSVMVWRSFSGTLGCAGLYLLPKNTTMNSPLGTRTGRPYADVHGYVSTAAPTSCRTVRPATPPNASRNFWLSSPSRWLTGLGIAWMVVLVRTVGIKWKTSWRKEYHFVPKLTAAIRQLWTEELKPE